MKTKGAFTCFRRLLPACVMLAAAWIFYTWWIAPLRKAEKQATEKIERLHGLLVDAHREVKDVQALEAELGRRRITHYRAAGDLPRGSAMAWIPDRLKQYFSRLGFNECTAQFNTSVDEPALSGYARTYWAVSLPIHDPVRDVGSFLAAVGQLEQTDPLIRVMDVAIGPDLHDPNRRTGVVNVGALARKEGAVPMRQRLRLP